MKRSVKVERLYSLGDYKNIKVIDELLDIPDNVALNPEAMSALYSLLLANVDLQFYKYSVSYRKAAQYVDPKNPDTLEVAITHLTELVDKIHVDLKDYFSNGNVDKTVE